MVIFYLQQAGALPCLQNTTEIRIVSGYNCAFRTALESGAQIQKNYSTEKLGQYLLGFFEFYGNIFNFVTSIISVRLGRAISRQEKAWN